MTKQKQPNSNHLLLIPNSSQPCVCVCVCVVYIDFLSGSSGKESCCQHKRHRRYGFDLWVGKIPWRRAWPPTPVFLPGEFHGQKSLEGYSP